MTKPRTPKVRVSDPADLLDTVAYLLGFHPSESLVVIGLARDPNPRRSQLREVRLALRVDIPTVAVRAGDFSELTDALRRADAGSLICVWLTDRGEADRARLLSDVHEVFAADAHAAQLTVIDVLTASGTRWWSASCDDPRCCPPEGRPRRIGDSVAAAEATFAGLVALPERDCVQALFDGRPDSERAALAPLIEAAVAEQNSRRDPADFVAHFLSAACRLTRADEEAESHPDGPRDSPLLSDAEVVSHGLGLRDISVRDELWMLIDDGALQAEPLLRQLHSRLPAPYDAAALFLHGWSRWRAGDGVQAAMAAERALHSDQRYSAAALLLATVRGGMDPRRTPPLSESIRGGSQ